MNDKLRRNKLFQNFENCRYIKQYLFSGLSALKLVHYYAMCCGGHWVNTYNYAAINFRLFAYKAFRIFCHAFWEAHSVCGKIEKSEIGWACGV
jgi:hypothetical protein